MPDEGAIFINLDDNELYHAKMLMNQLFGNENFVVNLTWQKKVSPSNDAKFFSSDHDNILVYAGSKEVWRPHRLPMTEAQKANYKNPDNDPRGTWNSVAYTCNKSRSERENLYYPVTNPNTHEQTWPKESAVWAYSKEEHEKHKQGNLLYWGKDGLSKSPRLKLFFLEESRVVPRSIWFYKDVGHTQEATAELQNLFVRNSFSSPKPTRLLHQVIRIGADQNTTCIDFFAGSGTTGHAIISMNREDKGKRKYILVDVAEYFDSVLKPRIMKAVYSAEWKDGKPVGRQGVSHCFKYLRLESYEDCLNNLRVERSPELSAALEEGSPDFREEYLLGYLLDFETRDSLLSLADFRKPFAYQLRIANGSAGESVPRSIDLVETFNYLLGLRVRRIRGDNMLRTVEGTLPDGRRALVLWRDCDAINDDALRERFTGDWLNADPVPDVIYVNGPNTLRALRPENAVWTVQSLEETFLRRMFDGEEGNRP